MKANENLEIKVKERTQELQISRQKLLLHVQQTPLAVIEFGIDGAISDWNPAAEKIFGYTRNEALGRFWTFIVPEKFHSALEGVWETLVAQKGGSRSSNENVTKDGRIITCEWFNTPLVDGYGKTIAVASSIMDITESKRAELIIRNNEKELREYLDVTPFPIAIVDIADNNINFWSRSALALFGHTAKTSKEWYDLAYPDPVYQNEVVERWKPKLESARKSSTPINTGEYNITCNDGSVRICELYIAFMADKLIITFNDITKRKVAEEEVKKHRDHLEEMVNERTVELDNAVTDLKRSNQELEQFAYVASHDLQEPLRMVSSYTQLLERRYKDQLDQDAKDFIFFAVDGANRMQRLINDLLDYSRVTTKGKPFLKLDLASVLGQAIANLQKKIQETGAMIVNDDLPFAYGDEVQLVRVFQNLLDNALKFTGTDPPRINVTAKTTDDNILISISDNGIGIDKVYAERVFTIFQRLHNKIEYPGTGIGLAICKRIIERHGGKIWFESEPGKGTTFCFTLNFK
jgi:PAS domain S-box-containing protein